MSKFEEQKNKAIEALKKLNEDDFFMCFTPLSTHSMASESAMAYLILSAIAHYTSFEKSVVIAQQLLGFAIAKSSDNEAFSRRVWKNLSLLYCKSYIKLSDIQIENMAKWIDTNPEFELKEILSMAQDGRF